MKKTILSIILILNLGWAYGYDVAITQENHTQPTEIELAITAQVNKYRTSYQLTTLQIHPNLVQAAQNYAKTMAENDAFDHNDTHTPANLRPTHRTYKTGLFMSTWLWENLLLDKGGNFTNKSKQEKAEMAVQAWHESKGHREAMQNQMVTYTGVGVYTLKGKTYICQLFAYLPFEIKNIAANEEGQSIKITGQLTSNDSNYTKVLQVSNENNKTIGQLQLTQNTTFTLTYKKNTGKHVVKLSDQSYSYKVLFIDTDADIEQVVSTVRQEMDDEPNTWVSTNAAGM